MMTLSEAIGGAPFLIGDLLEWPARLCPNRIAIDDNGAVTYQELLDRSVARSILLAQFGVRRFERWGLVANSSSEFFVSLFALLRLGAVVAPIYGAVHDGWMVPAPSSARLAGIVGAPGVSIPTRGTADPAWQLFTLSDDLQILASARGTATISHGRLIDVDPALILWSSGSTRAPRGVALQHRAVLANVRANVRALDLHDADRTMVVLPVAHAYALIHQCLCHLAIGATLFCPQPPLMAPSLCRQLEEFEITTLSTVPAMLQILVEGLRLTGRSCPRLRMVTVGAGTVARETLARAIQLLPNVRFAITYGLTEAGPRVATKFIDLGEPEACDPHSSTFDPQCVGVPLPNVEVRVGSEDDEISEISVRGSSIMRSYADEPWDEGLDHSIRTFDLGEFRDDRLYFRGRRDRSINRGGVLIAGETIEAVLMRHPAITGAVVRPEPHAFWGEVPVALLSFQDGLEPSSEELRKFCSQWLPAGEIPVSFERSNGVASPSSKDQKMLALIEEDARRPPADL